MNGVGWFRRWGERGTGESNEVECKEECAFTGLLGKRLFDGCYYLFKKDLRYRS